MIGQSPYCLPDDHRFFDRIVLVNRAQKTQREFGRRCFKMTLEEGSSSEAQ